MQTCKFCLLVVSLLTQTAAGPIQLCATDEECGAGRQCVTSHVYVGSGYCRQSGLQVKRTGSCPTRATGQGFVRQGNFCTDNTECGTGQRCCTDSFSGFAKCTQPTPCPNGVRMTIVRPGTQTITSPPPTFAIQFHGTMTVVQSGCWNVLIDAGGYTEKMLVLSALRDQLGLYPDDIDVVVMTHGHPDHYGNVNLFPRAQVTTFDAFNNIGTIFSAGPIFAGQPYYLLNDPNMELIQTPGHTLQDTSLIVRNEARYGTVGIVGDLIMSSDDYNGAVPYQNLTALTDNRRKVGCLVDFIVPGHGNIFQVTAAHRRALGPC